MAGDSLYQVMNQDVSGGKAAFEARGTLMTVYHSLTEHRQHGTANFRGYRAKNGRVLDFPGLITVGKTSNQSNFLIFFFF